MKQTYMRKLTVLLSATLLLIGGCGTGGNIDSSQEGSSGSASEIASSQEGSSGSASKIDNGHTEASSSVSETTDDQAVAAFAQSIQGMTPIPGSDIKDGVYSVQVNSSSSMFKITDCRLTVKDGVMTALMTMSGTGYQYVYMGTAQEAEAAAQKGTDPDKIAGYIPFEENSDGSHAFQIPVEALDEGIPCAAFSKKREIWYDRILVFRSDSLPPEAFLKEQGVSLESLNLADGLYTVEVSLEGGSGRASVESPAVLQIENGKAYAAIVWGSSNYDYMKIGDEKLEQINREGNSAFRIPVDSFDQRIKVMADTIAMSQPHEIEYFLTFDSSTIRAAESESSDSQAAGPEVSAAPESGTKSFAVLAAGTKKSPPAAQAAAYWDDMKIVSSLELSYADQFAADYYKDGYVMITIGGDSRYLLIPQNKPVPANLPAGVTLIRQPVKNIYLAATSAMDLFRSLDGIDAIRLSGTDADGWYIDQARQAMKDGRLLYAGKYNAPDYERILSENCGLAIESTMIYHSPEVKEQLERLGIPVLVERSSYESHPLGRMEWLKLYGVLLGKEETAGRIFSRQLKQLEPVLNQKPAGKTAAFFYIGSNGTVNVRKSSDYVPKMIELAGGTYVPAGLSDGENALSTMNMEMEAFYQAAKDADYIIYNSTIPGELTSVRQLISKSPLFKDFKAVQNGNVWCTEQNLFQSTMGLGDAISDIHRILTEENPDPRDMKYFYHLN